MFSLTRLTIDRARKERFAPSRRKPGVHDLAVHRASALSEPCAADAIPDLRAVQGCAAGVLAEQAASRGHCTNGAWGARRRAPLPCIPRCEFSRYKEPFSIKTSSRLPPRAANLLRSKLRVVWPFVIRLPNLWD